MVQKGVVCLYRHTRLKPLTASHGYGSVKITRRLLGTAEIGFSSGTWLAPFAVEVAHVYRSPQIVEGKSPEAFLDHIFQERGLLGPGFSKLLPEQKVLIVVTYMKCDVLTKLRRPLTCPNIMPHCSQETEDGRNLVKYRFRNGLAHQYTILLQLREIVGLPATSGYDHLAGMRKILRTIYDICHAVCSSNAAALFFGPMRQVIVCIFC